MFENWLRRQRCYRGTLHFVILSGWQSRCCTMLQDTPQCCKTAAKHRLDLLKAPPATCSYLLRALLPWRFPACNVYSQPTFRDRFQQSWEAPKLQCTWRRMWRQFTVLQVSFGPVTQSLQCKQYMDMSENSTTRGLKSLVSFARATHLGLPYF